MNLNLDQFHGTENYYQYIGFKFTDGIKYLAENAKCYWLLDIISSYQTDELINGVTFQVWELEVNSDKSAKVIMRSSTSTRKLPIVEQKIPYTDFPLEKIKLWLINKILLLPSEY